MAAYAGLSPAQYYPGTLTAPMVPGLSNSLASLYGFAGAMDPYNQALFGAGGNALGAVDQGLGWLYDTAQGGAPQYQFNQGVYDQTLANLLPTIEGDFNAAMRDPYRQLTEQVLPGIDVAASLGGDYWGTMPQNQSAIAARGYQDTAADVWSSLYSNAVNQAQAAGYGAGVENLSAQQALNDLLLQGYGSFGQLGSNMLGQGFGQSLSALDPGFIGGQYQQGYDQSAIDREIEAYLFNQQSPIDFYANQLGMFTDVGSTFGTNQTTNSTGLGNIAAGLAGTYLMGGGSIPGLSSLGSIFGGGAAASPLGGYGMGAGGNFSNILGQNSYNPTNPFGTNWNLYTQGWGG